MKKNKKKLFIACDTSKISKVKKILKYTKNKQNYSEKEIFYQKSLKNLIKK